MALPSELYRIKSSIEQRSDDYVISPRESALLQELRVLDDLIPLDVLRQKLGETRLTAPASGKCGCCGQDLQVGL